MKKKFDFTPNSLNIKKSLRRIEDMLTIVGFYKEKMLTTTEIGEMFGISAAQVLRILEANEVEIRPRGRNR